MVVTFLYTWIFSLLFSEYELFNTVNDQERKTFNAINGQYTELDSNYSNIFTTKKIQNRIGTSLIYEYKKHFLVTGIYVRNVQIENSNEISSKSRERIKGIIWLSKK